MKKYYATTPLYYVNAEPHIGHAYTTVAADALCRFKRLMGYNVRLLTGTDEYGQKVEKASAEAKKTPEEFTQSLSESFRNLWERLGIEYDDFIRTTQRRHHKTVDFVWRELEKKGEIYIGKYEGWYCTPCEAFWPYREVGGAETKNKTCPQCQRPLDEIKEENYFFKMSKHQCWLIEHIRKNPEMIQPPTRHNETLSFLEKNELSDLCISRPKSRLHWGIPCPLSDQHVTYVWFDALLNYISALGYPGAEGLFKDFWPSDVHFIGKDILRPHTVYWPIMLHALGLAPPKMVFAHGWWVQGKEKMSKSKGNVIRPDEVIEDYGVDAFRYFLLREVTFGQDGVYSDEAMVKRYNTDLANDLGNLFRRTLTMLEKYCEGVISADGAGDVQNVLRDSLPKLAEEMEKDLNRIQFSLALEKVWLIIDKANKFIEESQPWKLAKEKKDKELRQVLVSLCEVLRVVAQAVQPFMPQTARKMWEQMGLDPMNLKADSFQKIHWNYFSGNTRIQMGEALFPRLEKLS